MTQDTLATASRVILVRHGLPGEEGAADPGLGDAGNGQAQRLGAWLRGEPVAQVVSSHYKRAHQTALLAAEPHGLDVLVDERFREWDSDRTSYATPEAIADTPQGRAFAEGRFEDFVPKYDKAEVAQRMRAAVLDATRRAPGQLTVVASHGGAINTLLSDILQAPSPFFFNPGYTSMSRIAVLRSERFVIESVNDTGHLR
ncbi:histidine phosphatase family protein [Rhodococcoides fascians]|uniref:histidine phosphatase family protein n=1 Tax=Nocardiaceae TaxID=85025 RepID=UPI00050BF86C|nr:MULTISPECIES: histidine phosphatase family protein [Rhodococcus]MDP9635932.1 broad specificity phosphatase PhoE [Rhodococcus cercidiphylli]AMY52371.1 Phosphoserine phosphatase 1 [Rhodococcus fascians D188]MBY4013066.1 histidine phosphatase family protein [Rhodococcus fascians]MBY4020847.1 histidine phosphatase family protein [Rhodococcus fascians]MBY4207036.1 histidine phosphatase family protein [Rhodococcus fascians]